MSATGLVVDQSAGKGRGVFAAAAFTPGALVAAAPVIELGAKDADALADTVLDNYYFAHPQDPDGGLLVLGVASLCNHSDAPNVDTTFRHVEGIGWLVELRATRAIAPGEEVTRRYACELWFDARADRPAAENQPA